MRARTIAIAAAAALLLGGCGYRGGMGSGPYGAGPGPGMMGGQGPGVMGGGYGMGMGMGMMGSPGAMWWALDRLDLSADQRRRIAAIHDEMHRSHWSAMQALHAQGAPHGGWGDDAAERQRFEQMSALHKQMFDAHLEARRRILEVLTPAQRQQLTGGRAGG